jgi:uncharacterized membrane protein HdeD (DUF308 family)
MGIFMNTNLLPLLCKNWWVLLLRGFCGVMFGLLALVWPGLTLVTLIFVYGAFAGADGITAILAAIRGGTIAPRWWLVLVGLFALAASAMAFFMPGVTALILLYIIGGWAVARGIFEIVGAIQLRKVLANELALILSGLLSVAFGILVFVHPGAGALSLVWLIGAYAMAAGLLCIALSLRLKRHLSAATT